MQDHTPKALTAARKLRREMSMPEGLLWQQLRQRPMGLKFRSQHPIGNLIVDFYCASRKLVIEIDGISHDLGNNPQRDHRRNAWLQASGYEVIRIAASEVLRDPAAVAASLVSFCASSPPPSALRAATSPKGGDSFGVTC